MRIELLRAAPMTGSARTMTAAMASAIRDLGDEVVETKNYKGSCDALLVFGVGHPVHDYARRYYVKSGRHAVLMDLGYFGINRREYARFSIDHDHPQTYLDATPNSPGRWKSHRISLREDFDPRGRIILVGLGMKSRAYLRIPTWEQDRYRELVRRFPEAEIIFRPKGKDRLRLPCHNDGETPIQQLLKGASLVVCRHSNVSVDACIAGIPFECEDGAAKWLPESPTLETRLDFLYRLAHWQYLASEAKQAWKFIRERISS